MLAICTVKLMGPQVQDVMTDSVTEHAHKCIPAWDVVGCPFSLKWGVLKTLTAIPPAPQHFWGEFVWKMQLLQIIYFTM